MAAVQSQLAPKAKCSVLVIMEQIIAIFMTYTVMMTLAITLIT
jgi:hypothetical protein